LGNWNAGLRVLALAVLAGCGPRVTTQRDSWIPIPRGATYAWGGGSHDTVHVSGERDLPSESAILAGQIRAAIDTQMTAKGFRLADSTQADFLVHYHVGTRQHAEAVTSAEPSPPGVSCGGVYPCWEGEYTWGYWGAPEQSSVAVVYREGQLMVDLIERSSGKLAWRGLYHETNYRTPVTQQVIKEAVAKTMKSLPRTGGD
jgi:hypothetical protein